METKEINKALQSKGLSAEARKALERKNYDELLVIIYQLYGLLPPDEKIDVKIKGTGLG